MINVCVFQEELLGMKQRVRVVVVENEKLHEELKAKMVEDTLKEYTLLDGTVVNAFKAVTEIKTLWGSHADKQQFLHVIIFRLMQKIQ